MNLYCLKYISLGNKNPITFKRWSQGLCLCFKKSWIEIIFAETERLSTEMLSGMLHVRWEVMKKCMFKPNLLNE